jgi:hypothetical protein
MTQPLVGYVSPPQPQGATGGMANNAALANPGGIGANIGNGGNAGFGLFANAPAMSTSPFGQAYTQGYGTAGVGGTESQGQQGTIGMLQQMAMGGGPNPAHQATLNAQAMAQAQAGGARGNFGLAGAQHNAAQAGANVGQQGAQAQVSQQANAISALQAAQVNQRSQDLQAQGMNAQQAYQQASITAGLAATNAQQTGQLVSGGAGALSGLLGMAATAA